MQVIPLQAVPSQIVTVSLNGQGCAIAVYQTRYGMFVNVFLNGILILGGVIAQNLNRIIRDTYFGFTGDLCFYDTQGSDDPSYDGLGGRYVLLYLEPSDPPVAT
jgi:hypothetical protein